MRLDPWCDDPAELRPEADCLGRPRHLLADALRAERAGHRAACWGPSGARRHRPPELPRAFGFLSPGLVDQADVVWCDHAFGGPDSGALLELLREAMRPGSLLAVVDIADLHCSDLRTWLADRLDLSPSIGLVEALPRWFVPLHTSLLPQVQGWRSLVFVGRR